MYKIATKSTHWKSSFMRTTQNCSY